MVVIVPSLGAQYYGIFRIYGILIRGLVYRCFGVFEIGVLSAANLV